MPPPFRSLEARPIDSATLVFDIPITTDILPIASTTLSHLTKFLSPSSTPMSPTSFDRPTGIFDHNETSPNATAQGSRDHGQHLIDMGQVKLIAAILGAMVSIIGLMRLLIWDPLRHCIPKKRLQLPETTLDRTGRQEDGNSTLRNRTRRRRWNFRKDLGGDGAADEPAPDPARSNSKSRGLVELFSLPITTTILPSATATLSNFRQLLSATDTPTNLTLDGRPTGIFNHTDTSLHSTVSGQHAGALHDFSSKLALGLFAGIGGACLVALACLCVKSFIDERNERNERQRNPPSYNLANRRPSDQLPQYPGLDGNLDYGENEAVSPRNQATLLNESRGRDLESGLGVQNINISPPPPYARGVSTVKTTITTTITTPKIATQQEARQAVPFGPEQSVFPPSMQNAARPAVGDVTNSRILETPPPPAPFIRSKIPHWFSKKKTSGPCGPCGSERDRTLNDPPPRLQIPNNLSAIILTSTTAPTSNNNENLSPSENSTTTNNLTEIATDTFSDDVLRSAATAFSTSNRLPTIAESASPTTALTGTALSSSSSASTHSGPVQSLGIPSEARNSDSSVSMQEVLTNASPRESSENPKGKTMSGLIDRVQSRRGRGSGSGSEESNATTSTARSGQWFGRDGVGLGMLMFMGWRGKGNVGGREEDHVGKATNVGFVGFGGDGLRS